MTLIVVSGGVKFWMITQVLNMVANAFSWGSIVAAVGTGAAGLIIIFGRAALLRLVRNYGIRGAANIRAERRSGGRQMRSPPGVSFVGRCEA